MARNEEKAQSMLNRFLAAKEQERKPPKRRRPFLASQCRDLADADRWRIQILREIGKKVMDIQNPGIDEHRLREMNDEINKLIREKWHWEARIVELGGPDHRKLAPKVTELEGLEAPEAPGLPSSRGPGYRYFGAAKFLPGVKELFEKPKETKKKRSRHDMYKCIDADYYGYRDEEDGILLPLEKAAEEQMRIEALAKWKSLKAAKLEAMKSIASGEVAVVRPPSLDAEPGVDADPDAAAAAAAAHAGAEGQKERVFVAHVPLPDEKKIEQMVVENKKAMLMRYVSETLLEEQSEAKELLNIKR